VVVAVPVIVAVAVAVALRVAVAVGVEVIDGVDVGVGSDSLAAPVSLTLADGFPLVALLLIAMLAEKVPLLVGANSTVTVETACG